MHRMTVSTTVAFALALGCVSGAFAQAQDTARGAMLHAEARKAVGGDDKLRAVKALRVAGEFKRNAGQTTIEGETEILIELPGKLRRNEDLSLPGGGPAIIRTEVLNGTEVWDENIGNANFVFRRGAGGGRGGGGRDGGDPAVGRRGGGRGPIDPEQLRQLQVRARQAELDRFALAFLLNTTGAVTWVGTAEAPDGKADVLEIKPAEGPTVRLFLDTATHMPLMLTWEGVAAQFMARRGGGPPPAGQGDPAAVPQRPQQATLRMTLGEYKTVGGIRLPHLMTRGVNDQTIEEWTVSNYRINPSLKADTFTKK